MWQRVGVVVAATFLGSTVVFAGPDPVAPMLQEMHARFVQAFIDSEGFGRARVTPMMKLMQQSRFEDVDGAGTCIERVALVGVARHDPPVAYDAALFGFQHSDAHSAALPARRGRPLTAVESQALARLRQGESLVRQMPVEGVQAMGAIRASSECLACHRGSREGDLLGALSYTMGRLQSPAGKPEHRYCSAQPAGIRKS